MRQVNQNQPRPGRRSVSFWQRLASILSLAALLSAPFLVWHLCAANREKQAKERVRLEAKAITPKELFELVKQKLKKKDQKIVASGVGYDICEIGKAVVKLPSNATVTEPGYVGIWRYWPRDNTHSTSSESDKNYNYTLDHDLGVGVQITFKLPENEKSHHILVYEPAPNSSLDRAFIAEAQRRNLNNKNVSAGNLYIHGTVRCVRVTNNPWEYDERALMVGAVEVVVQVGSNEVIPVFHDNGSSVVVGIEVDDIWQNPAQAKSKN